MREEATWWLNTAAGDIAGARAMLDTGHPNLCAFHAQQAAEKSLKALLAARGKVHRGHACVDLLEILRGDGVAVPADLETTARRLDLHYVQSRYPNGLGGDPTRYYDEAIAQECLEHAERILEFVRTTLAAR